ncbi:hypothetical protein AB0M44_49125 [Streptosporangium subroseum]|uniref:hypothetical protein n=1 Tax=Streptosporangium subroseum TaxID=106412 RepID=UPI0034387587
MATHPGGLTTVAPAVRIAELTRSYDDRTILDSLDLEIRAHLLDALGVTGERSQN